MRNDGSKEWKFAGPIARSYKEIGEFWDTHGLADYWDQTQPVEFELDIQPTPSGDG